MCHIVELLNPVSRLIYTSLPQSTESAPVLPVELSLSHPSVHALFVPFHCYDVIFTLSPGSEILYIYFTCKTPFIYSGLKLDF